MNQVFVLIRLELKHPLTFWPLVSLFQLCPCSSHFLAASHCLALRMCDLALSWDLVGVFSYTSGHSSLGALFIYVCHRPQLPRLPQRLFLASWCSTAEGLCLDYSSSIQLGNDPMTDSKGNQGVVELTLWIFLFRDCSWKCCLIYVM